MLEFELKVAQGLGKPTPPKAQSADLVTFPDQVEPVDVLRVLAGGTCSVMALGDALRIPTRAISRCLKGLVARGEVSQEGVKRGTVYRRRS